ncbi:MAG: cation transporter [Candidatus Pacebacteria bacterium]|nr:cation transporter [Candidatus Paceibacterota bacterium]
MDKIEISISGIRSNHCVVGIQTMTEMLHGVEFVHIDLDNKKGIFEVDLNEVSVQNIVEEIERLGYTARVQ